MLLIAEKFKSSRLELGLKQADIVRDSGFSARDVSQYESGEKSFIASAYIQYWISKGVDANWLYDDSLPASPVVFRSFSNIENNKKNDFAPILVTVDTHGNDAIVMVDQKAAAGYPQHYLEPQYYQHLPAFSIPTNQFRNATFRCFQVDGESMEPTFYKGDWAIASYVDNWDKNIREGYIYVVVTEYSVQIKRVLNRIAERGKLVLVSDNEAHSTKEIDYKEVLELWYVKAHIGFHMPNTRFSVQNKIHNLEANILGLEATIEAMVDAKLEARFKAMEQRIKQIQ
jgi:signal peptidase I/transcriptional regulator with XRE-family HTH domain